MQASRLEIAATWLALRLDTDNAIFYRQSDLIEVQELSWMLSCVCAKGLMNRAHAYKAAVAENRRGDQIRDERHHHGAFWLSGIDGCRYPDVQRPKGAGRRDQIQHIEMARDIAGQFNHLYKGQYFTLPEAVVSETGEVLKGLDGRKMSKSYNNTIPLFSPEKKLQKLVRKIKTNSLEPGEPKKPGYLHPVPDIRGICQ